jgi:hypothetical protein
MLKPMLKPLCASTLLVLALAAPAAAQNEAALKAFFEGKRVTLRLDMPGDADGVDVHADARQAVDFGKYKDNLKRYGIAIRAGESAVVTLVKVKKDLIEFQLGGGGFGTFGDDTSTTAYIPLIEKSAREKELERRIKDEDDRDRRRRMESELDDLRDRRERENRRIMAERERVSEMKRQRIADERLHGGSRFNLRYEDRVPVGIRPEDMMAALAEYVDFGGRSEPRTEPRAEFVPAPLPAPMPPPAPAPAGDISLLRKGLLRAEAERAFGRPITASERREGGIVITTLIFGVGEQRVSADFVEDVLVRYTITSR